VENRSWQVGFKMNAMVREQEIIEKSVGILKKYLNPQKIYLFGSRTKGKAREGSDFDFAIDSAKPNSKIQQAIEQEIENILGLYQVDIVYLSDIEDNFRQIILKTGKVIYER